MMVTAIATVMQLMRWFALLLILSALSVLSACTGSKGTVENQTFQVLFDKGRAYLERGNAQMALPALRQANALQPGNATLLAMLGLAYDQVGRHVQALAAIEKAQSLRPEDGNINNDLGVVRMRVHEACATQHEQRCRALLDQADEAFAAALQDTSLRAPEEVWFNRALLYKRRGYWRQMVAALEQTLQISDRYLPARLELADYYRTMRRLDLERGHLRRALQAYPEDVAILEQLADSFLLSNQWSGDEAEVRSLLSRILSLAPGTDAAQRASQRLLLLDEKR